MDPYQSPFDDDDNRFIQFVPITQEKLEYLKNEYSNNGDGSYDSFEEFLVDWHGYIEKDGVWEKYGNPNEKFE